MRRRGGQTFGCQASGCQASGCQAGVAAVAALVALGTPCAAMADEGSYSKYEQQAIDMALTDLHRQVEPSPEGKVVEEIIIRRLDVLEERDPLPNPLIKFLDWFHALSKPFTIERELLLHQGDKYDQKAVDETARNLRGLRQLSLVLCVPVRGSTPGHVKLLVITKDIWSLRLNSDFRVGNGGLERLLLQPSEENLAGIHHRGNLLFLYEPATLTFGTGYTIPRVGDSRIGFGISGNVIVNKHTGDFEGSYGTFTYGQPLYSTSAKWAYVGSINWLEETYRRFIGVDEATFDANATPGDDMIPYEYSVDSLAASFKLTRSFTSNVSDHVSAFKNIKHDISAGVEAKRGVYRTHQVGFDPAALAEFQERVLPVSDTRIYPFVQYETYNTMFLRTHDADTLALEENFRLGHDAYVKFYPVLEALGSSRTFVGGAAGLSLTGRLGDGFLRGYAEGVVEADTEQVYDASLSAGLHFVTPRFYIGRLVLDGTVFQRFQNFLNRHTTIGGSGRLRGYPTNAFIGENAVAANLEYRTRPLDIFTLQLAFAAFYDTGAAYDAGEFPDLMHDVGAGLRILIPQLDRTVLRLDWAFPLKPAPDIGVTSPWPGNVVFTFGQAFDSPVVNPPAATD